MQFLNVLHHENAKEMEALKDEMKKELEGMQTEHEDKIKQIQDCQRQDNLLQQLAKRLC